MIAVWCQSSTGSSQTVGWGRPWLASYHFSSGKQKREPHKSGKKLSSMWANGKNVFIGNYQTAREALLGMKEGRIFHLTAPWWVGFSYIQDTETQVTEDNARWKTSAFIQSVRGLLQHLPSPRVPSPLSICLSFIHPFILIFSTQKLWFCSYSGKQSQELLCLIKTFSDKRIDWRRGSRPGSWLHSSSSGSLAQVIFD